MSVVDDKFELFAENTRFVLRAMGNALRTGKGSLGNYYVCVNVGGEYVLHKLSDRAVVFQSDDCKLFMMTCLSYLEGEEI